MAMVAGYGDAIPFAGIASGPDDCVNAAAVADPSLVTK